LTQNFCPKIEKNAHLSSKQVTPSSNVEREEHWEGRWDNSLVDIELCNLVKIKSQFINQVDQVGNVSIFQKIELQVAQLKELPDIESPFNALPPLSSRQVFACNIFWWLNFDACFCAVEAMLHKICQWFFAGEFFSSILTIYQSV
jgi:hypothetical protein